jgi:hypothetical protein
MIRAERLEGLVWSEVKKALENPGLIVAGIESLDAGAEGMSAWADSRKESSSRSAVRSTSIGQHLLHA